MAVDELEEVSLTFFFCPPPPSASIFYFFGLSFLGNARYNCKTTSSTFGSHTSLLSVRTVSITFVLDFYLII